MPEAIESADSQMNDRLKSTLWYHIGQLVDEETINLGVNATPQYIGSLTELVWAQIGTLLGVCQTWRFGTLTVSRHHCYRP